MLVGGLSEVAVLEVDVSGARELEAWLEREALRTLE